MNEDSIYRTSVEDYYEENDKELVITYENFEDIEIKLEGEYDNLTIEELYDRSRLFITNLFYTNLQKHDSELYEEGYLDTLINFKKHIKQGLKEKGNLNVSLSIYFVYPLTNDKTDKVKVTTQKSLEEYISTHN